MSLSACNPDRGPEYTTPAEFGEVTVSPQTMAFDSEVRVKVSVSCPYGLRNVCILYMLDGDESDVRTVAKTEPPADVTSFDYEGVIPRQRAGRKVTFRIRALTLAFAEAFMRRPSSSDSTITPRTDCATNL